MPNEVNIYAPRYLAEVVRLAPPVHTYFLPCCCMCWWEGGSHGILLRRELRP